MTAAPPLDRSAIERAVSRFGAALNAAERHVTTLSRAGQQSDALALRQAVIAARVAYRYDVRGLSMREALPVLESLCERLERGVMKGALMADVACPFCLRAAGTLGEKRRILALICEQHRVELLGTDLGWMLVETLDDIFTERMERNDGKGDLSRAGTAARRAGA